MSRRSLSCLRRHLQGPSCAQPCTYVESCTGWFRHSVEQEGSAASYQNYRRLFVDFDPRCTPSLARRAERPEFYSQYQHTRSFIAEGVPAKRHHERRLVGYSQQQLYTVVSAVEHYKEFVPWCQRSVVVQRKLPDFVEAELEVGFKMFVERYSSQVYLTEPLKVLSKVSDSTLFDHLDTTWEFKPGPTPSTTWLNFDVDFAFKSPLYRHIASIFFDEVVKRMMGAFEERCRHLYGESALSQKRRMQA